MAGSKTNYAEGKLLDLMMGNQAWSPGANSVLALYTVAPGEAGGGTEANYAGYARKTVTNDLTTWPSANPKLNGIELAFPIATGDQAGNIVGGGHRHVLQGVQTIWGPMGQAEAEGGD